MKVGDRHFRTIWLNDDGQAVDIIDQRWLPHEFRVETLSSVEDIATAIRDMWVRGAPLIGVTAAYGMALQMRDDPSDDALDAAWATLNRTRPTAINLRWALDEMRTLLRPLPTEDRLNAAYARAAAMADEDVELNQSIGRNGLDVIRRIAATKAPGEPVNILTHCNAGWVATVDRGTAISPEMIAQEREFIRARLRHHIATAAVGSTLAKRVLNGIDPQIKAAISSLPAAAALNRSAERAIRSERK